MVYPVLVTRPLYDGPLPESYPGVSRDESGATVEIQVARAPYPPFTRPPPIPPPYPPP